MQLDLQILWSLAKRNQGSNRMITKERFEYFKAHKPCEEYGKWCATCPLFYAKKFLCTLSLPYELYRELISKK